VRTLVLGVSTRAIAESAVRSGQRVVTVDFFGDWDQKRIVENYSLHEDLDLPRTARGLAAAAGRLDAEAVVYGANLENHPELVRHIAEGRTLLGNGPEVLQSVRDWRILGELCREAGIAHAATLLAGEEGQAQLDGRWLSKRVGSGGGHGIRPWDGEMLDHSHMLQRETRGRAASVAFVADGTQARVIGLSEQLLGVSAFGASGFTWCGNLVPLDLPTLAGARILREVEEMVSRLTRLSGLRGVNGIDFVVAPGPDGRLTPTVIEVNPRYAASMELMEAMYGVNVFSLHLEAMAGRLPDPVPTAQAMAGYFGKAVVYARRTVTTPDTSEWFERDIRDIPFTGQRVEAGHPVCTILARGADRRACMGDLLRRAQALYQEIEGGREACRERATHFDNRTYA
jgi:predicted ATP-grasp superfamily ATP-dependent carboligase